jgi:hypothetical protein
MDEHYEFGRPKVIATLIPQTTTAEMAWYAFSDFDNATRTHYTLAARPAAPEVFTVSVAMNGTAGSLLSSAPVSFPAPLDVADVTFLFTFRGLVYVAFAGGQLATVVPATGAVTNVTALFPPSAGLTDGLAADFDGVTGTFYANAAGGDGGFFLHTYNVLTGATTQLGPLPPAPGTAGPGGARVDSAAATLVVYPPAGLDVPMRLLELRESADAPFEFFAWLDPVAGNSTQLAMPDDWYDNWDIDPNYFPSQWPGTKRRVWSYDSQNGIAFFKLYDECGGHDDSCDENECLCYLEWQPGDYVDFYVAVEPVEPQLTQAVWVWTDKIEAGA